VIGSRIQEIVRQDEYSIFYLIKIKFHIQFSWVGQKMSLHIWARPLTNAELEHFRSGDLESKTFPVGPLSVMGSSNHPHIVNQNIKLRSHRVYLGDGQYLDESTSSPPAVGGRKVPVVWSAELPYVYLLLAAKNLEIPVFCTENYPQYKGLIYFENIHEDAFLNAFTFADQEFDKWYKNRPLLSRFFGGTAPLFNSIEAKYIFKSVQDILSENYARNRQRY
jgi:hypothetical protein